MRLLRCESWVFASAHPDFFIAHYDVANLLTRPIDSPVVRTDQLKGFHLMCEAWRTMDTVSLAKIAGRVGGGGSEFSASLDMRFGLLGKTVVNQMEVPIGILPGGTGTQRLPRLMGRGRAMEVVLGGIDLDAATAERWGYLNRAFATAVELDRYVDDLARRIAGFPPQAVALAKRSVLAAEPDALPAMLEEAYNFEVLMRTPEAKQAMTAFLAQGGQTAEGELRVGALNGELRWRDANNG